MKKASLALVALLALAVALFVVFKKTIGRHVPAAQLVPGETLLFINAPNLPRTALRWPQTGLAQIFAEPEVVKFLEKARTVEGSGKVMDERLKQILRLAPREAFAAVTSIDGPQPKWIAGFAFLGRKGEARALLAEPRAGLKRAQPAGKSDIVSFGGTEVETFTYGETVLAEAFKEDWYLISNNLDLLKTTMTATGLPAGAPDALGKKDLYQKAVAKLPTEGDLVVFSQLGAVTGRITSLLKASGQPIEPAQLAQLERMQAVAWGTKLDGAQVRDTIFLLAPGGTPESPLPRNALAFSAADTFLYYGVALPAKIELPDSAGLVGGYLPMLGTMERSLAEKGLTWADLSVAFGPELGAVLDWAPTAPQPTALLALDVRDAAKARAFVEVFTGTAPGTPAWGRKEENGVTLFQSPPGEGLLPISPSLALTGKFLILGFSPASVEAGLGRVQAGVPAIAQNPAYLDASKVVGVPTSGFGYLDTKTLFERSYGTLRPFIAMSLAFHPEAGQYLDAGKLPSTETISRHLLPSIYSQSVTADGTLIESTGTLTFNQVLMAAIGGGIAAAFPMIEEALKGGLDPMTLLPPTAAPTPAPPVPDPAPAAPEI